MPSRKKQMIADLLFMVQIVCALLFGGGQCWRMLTTTQGVSISWFVCWEVFLALNLVLAVRAHRNQSSRVTKQTLWSYGAWTTIITFVLIAMLLRGTGEWNERDSATVILASAGGAGTLIAAWRNKLTIADPLVRGYLATFAKAVPQLVMAYNILLLGGAGLAATTVWAGHVTVLTRLGQLWFSIREAGWDRSRRGSAISELANEGSWIITTVAWLVA